MTLNEYLNEIFLEIKSAKSQDQAIRIIKKAEKVLGQSDLTDRSRRSFWVDLYNKLKDDPTLILEKQAASSLSNIVAAAQQVIADNIDKHN